MDLEYENVFSEPQVMVKEVALILENASRFAAREIGRERIDSRAPGVLPGVGVVFENIGNDQFLGIEVIRQNADDAIP